MSMAKHPAILHLCYDEKWMRGGIELFESAFPSMNKFLVTRLDHGGKELKYLPKDHPAIQVHQSDAGLDKLIDIEVAAAKLVVIHGMDSSRREVLERSVDTDKFIWLIKGADMYQNPFIWKKPLLAPLTAQLHKKLGNTDLSLKQKVRKRLLALGISSLAGWQDSKLLVKKSMKHLKMVGTWQKVQFDFLRDSGIVSPKADFLHFTYYPLESMVKNVEDINQLGPNILLGNSASFTNNHLEALELLAKFKLDDRKVIAPLNYGDKKYAAEISRSGKQMLSDNFDPKLEWMQLDEYNKILSSCSIVVMNHNRGQAAGNVISTLYMGCKIYLSEKNLIYTHLKALGCQVFSIESDLNPANPEALVPLSREQVEVHRSLLRQEMSREVLIKSLQNKLGALL